MVSSVFLLTTVLATYASAARVLIGFRTVCEAEAAAINSRGWVYWDSEHPSAKWDGQLGIGKSHSNKAGLWSGAIASNAGGDWFCYTTAEDSMIRKAGKVWINPIEQPAAGQGSYPYDEAKIQDVLKAAGAKKPEKALRLGVIMDGEELLIPARVLPGPSDEDGGQLDLQTFCFETKKEMKAHMVANGITAKTADYDSETFTSKNYKTMDQAQKRATIDEGEGEDEGPLLRFMPRDSKKPATKPSSNTLHLAKGYTITLKKDPKAKKFPIPRADTCPRKPTYGKKPKVIGSSKKSKSGGE